jgi:alkylresorcinol/alkylpyrone synthase/polyketide synthase Type III
VIGGRRPSLDAAGAPRLISVGTATPPRAYSQQDVLDRLRETDPKIIQLFRNSHIERRHLYLPETTGDRPPDESNQELIDKHLRGVLEIGPQAITRALEPLGLAPQDVDCFVSVTSTGLLCPGVTAHLAKAMAFRDDVKRVDVLGMGCNAAMNGLEMLRAWSATHPRRIGLMLCVEVCSAAYALNRSMSTAVVNSLFGDGAGAVVVRADPQDDWRRGPGVIDSESLILTEAIDAMKYELDGTKLSFYLEKDIPWVIGKNVPAPVGRLLARHGLTVPDVDHWIVHSGGKKVIDAIVASLELPETAVRHTRRILRDFGNMSSASVLFSFETLRQEGVVREGDVGVMIAMGPGTQIETALIAW